GRTGRMDQEGEAITLLTPDDLDTWKKIQRGLGGTLKPRPWPQREMPLPDAPTPPVPAPAPSTAASAAETRSGERDCRHGRASQGQERRD
ncbi:hypothetical protein, partial [Klebsiella pneumoniae]|uniref:hypothetical protein n=1 Tax=Klebsiella pneumoniae TaxID=573 RepID=UPI00301338D1